MLSVNQIICWHSDNHLERVIHINSLSSYIVTIDINNSKAQPTIHRYKEIESAFLLEQASILHGEPDAKYLITDSELSSIQREYRDNAWKAISLIIAYGESIFDPYKRSQIIKEVKEKTGRSEPTIRKDLRRYWQGGQTKNALIPRFNSTKGQEKPNPISSYYPKILNYLCKYALSRLEYLPEPTFWSDEDLKNFVKVYKILTTGKHPKRGRPSFLSQVVGKRLGINITVEIREKFRKGIKLFYETRQKMPLTKAYQKNLEKFFHQGYKLSDGRGELEGYNANNLSDCLGIEINNTPPYRADFKGIIERSFRAFNDEIIHWLPGSVKKLPERGERDYRIDGVLTIDAFRKLMILFILDHNNENLLI
ncbi:hypothetical protein A6S26_25175 [Nostoc sp. ATCC 43529]|nr:hypothetical protein A6S26_25175 [Nostoc sp. ATCC 43529]